MSRLNYDEEMAQSGITETPMVPRERGTGTKTKNTHLKVRLRQ